MSSGHKVATGALVVLVLCVVGYYMFIAGDGDEPDPTVVGLESELPQPDPAAVQTPNQREPGATTGSRQPQPGTPAPPPNDPAMTPAPGPSDANDDSDRTSGDDWSLPDMGSLGTEGSTTGDGNGSRQSTSEANGPATESGGVARGGSSDGSAASPRSTGGEPNRSRSRAPQPDEFRMETPDERRRPTIDESRPPTGDAGQADDMTRYTVQIGDSLWTIAKKKLGAGHKWRLIAKANNLPDNATLQPGQELIIPRPEPDQGPVSEPSETDPLGLGLDEDMRTVTVQEGDSLWTIAQREYRDGTKWRMIYTANKSRMDSPNDLHPGDKLVVPPLPDNADD